MRLERVLSVVDGFQEATAQDRAYWLTRSPQERLKQVERLRRANYGDRATARLERTLEVVERHRS